MESWVNFSGKEGHTEFNPRRGPEIEPGTFGFTSGSEAEIFPPTPLLYERVVVFSYKLAFIRIFQGVKARSNDTRLLRHLEIKNTRPIRMVHSGTNTQVNWTDL